MHEVDVFRQRLAQGARHRLDPTVGDETAADLCLDHLAELPQAGFVLLASEPGLEVTLVAFRFTLALALLLRPLHEALGQAVVVELAQRPVEVVRPADRPAGLHPGEAGHRHRRDLAELVLVHVHRARLRSISASSSLLIPSPEPPLPC